MQCVWQQRQQRWGDSLQVRRCFMAKGFYYYYSISTTPLPKVVCVVTGAADNCDRFVIIIFFLSLIVSSASTSIVQTDLNQRFCFRFSILFTCTPCFTSFLRQSLCLAVAIYIYSIQDNSPCKFHPFYSIM